MDTKRAEEILNSSDRIQVMYNGSPVWIENVNSNSVEITHFDGGKREIVPVTSLVEQMGRQSNSEKGLL